MEAAQRASQIPQSRPRPRSRRQISRPLPGARSNQRRPANRGRGDLAEVWAGLGWWEPGSHGVGAGALLLRRPVAQGASRGREEAGMPVCCLLVARNVDLGHTQSLIVEQHVRVQRRGIGGIVLLSAMAIVHSIVLLAVEKPIAIKLSQAVLLAVGNSNEWNLPHYLRFSLQLLKFSCIDLATRSANLER